MKAFSLGLALALAACTVKSNVASNDDNRSASQRLSDQVDSFCSGECSFVAQCPQQPCTCTGSACSCRTPPDPTTCASECQDFMAPFAMHGDACAELGLTVISCFSQLTCQDLVGDACRPSASAQQQACGSVVSGAPVTCQLGMGTGIAGSGGGDTGLTCELFYESCSDANNYHVICTTNQGVSSCSCLVNQQFTTSFVSGPTCPDVATIDAGCHWSLTHP